jgi:segregation and condensation protein A
VVGYEVRLEVFEGPFDLLLQLIARRRLEVTEIDLADITADFLAHLTALDRVDLDTATRFLVVAATLVELKAARLLPSEDREEVEDLLSEARDLLYARLLEYRAYRQLADEIGAALAATEHHVGRDVPLEPRFRRLVPDTTLAIDVHALARLAAWATAPPPVEVVDLAHVRRATVSIRDAASALLARLDRGRRSFGELTHGRERHERVVWFLAALELYKLGRLDLDQPDLRGPLEVATREGGRDLSSITDDDLTAATDEPPPDEESASTGGEHADDGEHAGGGRAGDLTEV